MTRILFTNVNILDCTGAQPFAGEVLIEGNRIKEVAKAGKKSGRDGGAQVAHVLVDRVAEEQQLDHRQADDHPARQPVAGELAHLLAHDRHHALDGRPHDGTRRVAVTTAARA